MADIGVVTVGERPTRVLVAISGLLIAGAGVAAVVHPGWDETVVLVAAIAWAALGLIGLAQLTIAVRRALS